MMFAIMATAKTNSTQKERFELKIVVTNSDEVNDVQQYRFDLMIMMTNDR